jgi:hypothetical protein
METTMTLETTFTELVDAAGTCFADPRAAPRRSAVGGLGMVGIEGVFIKEEGWENEMTATSPDQTKTLVLKAFDLLFNKHDYDARRTLPVEEADRVPPGSAL